MGGWRECLNHPRIGEAKWPAFLLGMEGVGKGLGCRVRPLRYEGVFVRTDMLRQELVVFFLFRIT